MRGGAKVLASNAKGMDNYNHDQMSQHQAKQVEVAKSENKTLKEVVMKPTLIRLILIYLVYQ